MVAKALHQGQIIVIVIGEDRGARQKADFFGGGQFAGRPFDPLKGRRSGDGGFFRLVQKGAAESRVLFSHDDTGPGSGRGPRGGQSGRPAAGDQYVAMGVDVLISVGVGFGGRTAKAAGVADDAFVKRPQAGWPHEGLVIKASRYERRCALGEGS